MWNRWFVGIVLSVFVSNPGFSQTPAERLNDFFLEMSTIAERYECIVFVTSFRTEDDGQRAEFTQCDFRRIVDSPTKRLRADIRTESPATMPGYYVFEHYLKTPEVAMGTTDVFQGRGIKTLSPNSPVQPPAPATLNLTLLPVFAQGSLNAGKSYTEDGIAKGNIICERSEAKGRKAIYIAHEANITGLKIVFAPEPAWLIEEIVFLKSPTNKLGQFLKEETTERVSEKEMMTWQVRGKTKTSWIRCGKKWVPNRITMTYSGVAYRDQVPAEFESTAELLFAEWKLGDDVDLELLTASEFTTEKIQKSINFDEWRSAASDASSRRTNKRQGR